MDPSCNRTELVDSELDRDGRKKFSLALKMVIPAKSVCWGRGGGGRPDEEKQNKNYTLKALKRKRKRSFRVDFHILLHWYFLNQNLERI